MAVRYFRAKPSRAAPEAVNRVANHGTSHVANPAPVEIAIAVAVAMIVDATVVLAVAADATATVTTARSVSAALRVWIQLKPFFRQ